MNASILQPARAKPRTSCFAAVVLLVLAFSLQACGGGSDAPAPGAPGDPGNPPGPGNPAAEVLVGGTISGLGAGKSLVVANADASGTPLQTLTFTANGSYSITLPKGTSYAVRIVTHPAGQGCDVFNGTGTAQADVSNIGIVCADEFAPSAPAGLTVTYGAKSFNFSWNAVPGARFYKLLEDPDGASGFAEAAASIGATSYTHAISVLRRLSATYALQACNFGGGCGPASALLAPEAVRATGYVKASTTRTDSGFGSVVAVSADGSTLAVAAPGQVFATGVPGSVHIFTRTASGWREQAALVPPTVADTDQFGFSLALSADGGILAVGARMDDGPADSVVNSGAVYVFARQGETWSQQAYLRASNAGAGVNQWSPGDAFGASVALSADGATLAVGAPGEDSDGSSPDNNGMETAGAVYVFTRTGAAWTERAWLKGTGIAMWRDLGTAVALSADGGTLAAGAQGVNNNAGAVHVFTQAAGEWTQQQAVTAFNPGNFYTFGSALSLAADGNTLAVGAKWEASNGSSPSDTSMFGAGAAYVFTREAGTWTQRAYLKAAGPRDSDDYGEAVALSGDGEWLLIGAPGERRDALGALPGGSPHTLYQGSGAAFLYRRSGQDWILHRYLKAPAVAAQDNYGSAVALSQDGGAIAIGSNGEDSAATGIGGNQSDDSVQNAGAVYLY